MNQPALIAVPIALENAVNETGLTVDGAHSLRSAYAPHFLKFDELAIAASSIKDGQPKAAREMRLEIRAVRISAEKSRKALKEDSLRRGKAIDGIYNVLEYQLAPVEKRMEEIEKAEEIAEANRKAALKAVRSAELLPFADPTFFDLANMPEAQWTGLLNASKSQRQMEIAAAAKVEAERIAAEKAAAEAKAKREADEAAERERMRAENERLAKVAAQERAAREEAERLAAKEKAQRDADAARLRAEADAREAAVREQARKEREEAERAAQIERDKLAKAQAELAAKEQAEQERIEADRIAAKAKAAAPDKQKVRDLAATVRGMPIPALTSEAGAALRVEIVAQIAKFADWVEKQGVKL